MKKLHLLITILLLLSLLTEVNAQSFKKSHLYVYHNKMIKKIPARRVKGITTNNGTYLSGRVRFVNNKILLNNRYYQIEEIKEIHYHKHQFGRGLLKSTKYLGVGLTYVGAMVLDSQTSGDNDDFCEDDTLTTFGLIAASTAMQTTGAGLTLLASPNPINKKIKIISSDDYPFIISKRILTSTQVSGRMGRKMIQDQKKLQNTPDSKEFFDLDSN